MIHKLVTSNSVIAKIISDLNIKDDSLRITDMRQWIAEAIEKIGAVTQLESRVEIIPIKQFQCKLPCDLHSIGQVAYSYNGSTWITIKKATSSFAALTGTTCCPSMYIQDSEIVPLVMNLFNYTTEIEAYEKINSDPNIKQTLSPLLSQFTVGSVNGIIPSSIENGRIVYSLKPGWIITNVPCGFIKLSYKSIITDADGMPMIPDSTSYFEALYWYVVMKLKYPEYLNGTLRESIYYDARRSWNFYSTQAYAEAMLPTQDDLENIKNTWNRLYPTINENDTFYSYLGEQEKLYV